MTVHETQVVAWTVGSTTYYVPGWAPARIIALAAMKPGAQILPGKPFGAVVWHPNLDEAEERRAA